VNDVASVPKNAVSTIAAAPLNVLWPEMYREIGVMSTASTSSRRVSDCLVSRRGLQ